jgi:hypothetical protein
MWNVKTKSDTGNNRDNWNHLSIIQTLPGQHTGKSRNQGTTNQSYIVHRTHTAESNNVKVQNIIQ